MIYHLLLLLYTLIKTNLPPQIGQPQLSFSSREQLEGGVVQGGQKH